MEDYKHVAAVDAQALKRQRLSNTLHRVFASESFTQASTLLIVPPFSRLTNAALGVHILQACAAEANQHVAILYANMLTAQWLGRDLYDAITFCSDDKMLGDRVFCAAAYDKTAFTDDFLHQYQQAPQTTQLEGLRHYTISEYELRISSEQVSELVQCVAQKVVQQGFKVVGCTSMFNQTAAAIAFIRAIKQQDPEIITLMGGANCAGEMAKGMASLSTDIDYIFSGESERAFTAFLQQLDENRLPEQQIIMGERCDDLDALATPQFLDYYTQADLSGLAFDWRFIHMPFESSRGCWWGQKYQCTFCGVHELRYRMKSPERVMAQLRQQLAQHRSPYVNFCDDIMPRQYFKTLLPHLQEAVPGGRFFIDQKANLSFRQVKTLAEAGVYDILPGIESLATELLSAIDKGTNAKQNLQMMRYARSCHLQLSWYFLYGIPGEQRQSYEHMRQLLPLITHLCPPVDFQQIKLLRFGLYVKNPTDYGVENLQPLPVYHDILPEQADIANMAYYFSGDYTSIVSDAPELVTDMRELVRKWREDWYGNADNAVSYADIPELSVTRIAANQYLLTDSRNLQQKKHGDVAAQTRRQTIHELINEQQAAAILVARPLSAVAPLAIKKKGESTIERSSDGSAGCSIESDVAQWAIAKGYAVELDNWLLPLATTTAELFDYFENNYNPVRKKTHQNQIAIEQL